MGGHTWDICKKKPNASTIGVTLAYSCSPVASQHFDSAAPAEVTRDASYHRNRCGKEMPQVLFSFSLSEKGACDHLPSALTRAHRRAWAWLPVWQCAVAGGAPSLMRACSRCSSHFLWGPEKGELLATSVGKAAHATSTLCPNHCSVQSDLPTAGANHTAVPHCTPCDAPTNRGTGSERIANALNTTFANC